MTKQDVKVLQWAAKLSKRKVMKIFTREYLKEVRK